MAEKKEIQIMKAETLKRIITVLTDSTANNVFSPALLYYTIAGLSRITDGDTKAELLSALSETDEGAADCLAQFSKDLYCPGTSDLGIAIFADESAGMKNEQIKELTARYGLDFTVGKMGTGRMNRLVTAWINGKTNAFLKKQLDIKTYSDELFRLVSAIYLKSSWTSVFTESKTEDFYVSAGKKVSCEMMRGRETAFYLKGENYSAASKMLENGYEMIFVLPDEGTELSDIAKKEEVLNILLNDRNSGIECRLIDMSLPKFDVSCKNSLDDSLKTLGIEAIFDFDRADFSPISEAEKIGVSHTQQISRIKVDEEGIEGASYIEVSIVYGSLIASEPFRFIIDRPFMFSVINRKNMPLFVGTVTDPTQR